MRDIQDSGHWGTKRQNNCSRKGDRHRNVEPRSTSLCYAGALDLGSALPRLNRPYVSVHEALRHEANQRLFSTTSSSILNPHRPDMSYLAPSTSPFHCTGRIGQYAIRGESQRQRYASFSCYAYQILSNGPRATVHILSRSTSSTMIHSLTSFVSIDQPSLTEMRVIISV